MNHLLTKIWVSWSTMLFRCICYGKVFAISIRRKLLFSVKLINFRTIFSKHNEEMWLQTKCTSESWTLENKIALHTRSSNRIYVALWDLVSRTDSNNNGCCIREKNRCYVRVRIPLSKWRQLYEAILENLL